jgi:hypothetical protein
LNRYLLTCRLDGTSACYKASTKTNKTKQYRYTKTLNKRNENNIARKSNIKSTGAKGINAGKKIR